ncbi:hypothetical protein AB0I77_29515 [Streptomyces sp. NPDC050619]|uniref:hypothetical protein n=1 Tax=Streptomyces sp. NPDC050619 TaxID=3157214 RepID=UPI00341DC665
MTERGPGEWPVDQPANLDATQHDYADDETTLYLRRAAERGRREIVLDSIRAHLEEQPTPNAVQAVTRHWIADVIAIGDDIAKAKRRST